MSELPKGWAEVALGDLIELKYGKSLPKTNRVPGEYKVFGSNGVVDTSDRSLTSAPAIVVGRKGSFGEVHFSENECFPIDTTYYVDEFNALVPRFAERLLKQLPLKKLNRATAIPGLNREDAYGLSAPVPPLAEQKRIVAKLDALGARSARARKELERIDALVARYKQAVLSKAFSGELTKDWRTESMASPSFRRLDGILEVPIRNGLSVKGSDTPPGVRALKLSALREMTVNMLDVRYLPISMERAGRFILEAGDILISRGNGTKELVGISALVPTHTEKTIFPDTAFRVRINQQSALPQWLCYIWNAPQCREQIEKTAKTTAGIWKISQKDLSIIELFLPSLPEQREIVRRIESAFDKIDRLAGEAKRALALVGRLDEAVLAKAFRGELVPQDPNDEPASVLLERIRAERTAAPKPQRGRKAARTN